MRSLLPILIFLSSTLVQGQQSQDSQLSGLLAELGQAKDDTSKVLILITISNLFLSDHPENGIQYTEQALQLSEKQKWNIGIIRSNYALGDLYWRLGNFDKAIKYHGHALEIAEKLNDKNQIAYGHRCLGQDNADGGNYNEALIHLNKAVEIYKATNQLEPAANIIVIMAFVYEIQGKPFESSKANYEALKIYESINNEYGIAITTSNIAASLIELGKFAEAIPKFQKAGELFAKLDDRINEAGIYNSIADAYMKLGQYEVAMNYAQKGIEIGTRVQLPAIIGYSYSTIAKINFEQGNYADAIENSLLAIEQFQLINSSLDLNSQFCSLAVCYARLKQTAHARSAIDSALYYEKKLDSRHAQSTYLFAKQLYDSLTGNWYGAYINYYDHIAIRDSIFNTDQARKLLQNQAQYDYDKKEAATRAEQEKKDAIAAEEMRRKIQQRNAFTTGFVVMLLFAGVFFLQRNKISKEKKRSEELLLNILPEETAEELKKNGNALAKSFSEVTVMFTDFKNFTQTAERLSPEELVQEIHYCYSAFDKIVSDHHLEKIKTIGDSYMCAGGLPVPNTTNAVDAVEAALAICAFMEREKHEREAAGKPYFDIRIGMHTGPVVAGIVGIKKFAYDIWGDTVNIASRMESSGEAGKVNISETTQLLVKDKFSCVHRGKISAKNKGEIDMYFVKNI